MLSLLPSRNLISTKQLEVQLIIIGEFSKQKLANLAQLKQAQILTNSIHQLFW